ncbi:MAG: hypothetical protein LUE10_09355, partial [Alistipes sp.]|nr:hypothetical protein [Alistipes sp.]
MARNDNPENEKAPVNGQVEETREETRSNRPAVKRGPTVAKRSAKKEARQAEDPEVKIETAISNTERYIIDNGKTLLAILAALVIVSGIIIAYKYMYIPNRAEKAGAAMYVAEQHFAEDSFDYALNGDGFNAGFLEVIDKYGST